MNLNQPSSCPKNIEFYFFCPDYATHTPTIFYGYQRKIHDQKERRKLTKIWNIGMVPGRLTETGTMNIETKTEIETETKAERGQERGTGEED
jgi:hypothetical protein